MKQILKIFTGVFITAFVIVSCEKKVEPINETYTVKVEYKSSGKDYVASDITINPKDTIVFDFTITAEEDMDLIEIQKNGARIDTFRVPATNRRSFSGLKKYVSDSIPGDYNYRIFARNKAGVFMGDNKKTLKVSIRSDFDFWSYRFLYVPDSTVKTNKSFFASTTGTTYSYSEGATNSAAIDFGFFYDTTTAGAPKHTLYALTNNTVFAPHDLSTWTKNATIFKRGTTPTFANITSGGILRTGGISNLASGATTKITALAAGNLIFFRTAAGKYGCAQISFIEGATAEKSTYINIDVKVQK